MSAEWENLSAVRIANEIATQKTFPFPQATLMI